MSIFRSMVKSTVGVIRSEGGTTPPDDSGGGSDAVIVKIPGDPGENVLLVRDFAEVMAHLSDSTFYTLRALRVASFIKRPVESQKKKSEQSSGLKVAYEPNDNDTPYVSLLKPQITVVPDVKKSDAASRARVNLFAFMDEVLSFSSQAKNAGFSPPDNPFVEIARLNSLRTKKNPEIPLIESDAETIVYNIKAYVNLLEAYSQGAINLRAGVFNAAQMEHVSVSYSGLGGTGNNAADLMRLLPNADEIKTQKARSALTILNFSKRIPHVVFVTEFNPGADGPFGVIIGWKRMPDAAGYVLKRHAVLSGDDVSVDIPNEKLIENEKFMDYVRTYVLTFYDKIKPEGVCLFFDESPPSDDYYIYRVQAYQTKKESSTSIIPSRFISMNLSGQQKLSIQQRIRELDPGDIDQIGEETISPWPVVAEQLLGDATLDWILAAANIRNSVDHGDEKAVSRKFSYLNSHVKFLLEQADRGSLVRPASIDDVRQAVSNAIQTYGVTQTIEAILQETGVLYHFDGRDSRDDTTFDRAGTLDFKSSGIIGAVIAAADPESATLDLSLLATNLATLLSDGKLEDYTTTLEMAAKKAAGTRPVEIDIDPDITSDKSAESGIQFVARLGEITDAFADLTTFDGISKMLRVIRVMSDFGPNRIQPRIPIPPPVPVDPPVETPAPPPPPPSAPPALPDPDVIRDSGRPGIAERIRRVIRPGTDPIKTYDP